MCGIVCHDCVSARAIARRVPRRGMTWSSAARAGARPAAIEGLRAGVSPRAAIAASTSPRVIRPAGPLPRIAVSSRPAERASLRTAGEASGRPGESPLAAPAAGGARGPAAPFAAGATGTGAAGAAAGDVTRTPPPPPSSRSNTASVAPTSMVSPGCPRRSSTIPVTGHGIVTIALSVWTSTSGWSSFTRSPTATCHSMISPASVPSPTSGSTNSTGTVRLLQRRDG